MYTCMMTVVKFHGISGEIHKIFTSQWTSSKEFIYLVRQREWGPRKLENQEHQSLPIFETVIFTDAFQSQNKVYFGCLNNVFKDQYQGQ